MRTLRSIVIVAAVAGMLVGCGEGSTPQKTFEGMKTSVKSNSMGGMLKYLTPESQNMLAGGMAFGATMAASMGKKFGKADADLEAIVKKHGLDAVELPKLGAGSDTNKVMIEFGSKVKDKPGFLKDMEDYNKKKGKKQVDLSSKMGNAVLKDVKITGTTAEGKIVTTADGKEKVEPIFFKQINGEWLVDMIASMEASKKAK